MKWMRRIFSLQLPLQSAFKFLNNSNVNDNVQLIGKSDYGNLPQQTGICQENFTGAAQTQQNFTEARVPVKRAPLVIRLTWSQ